MRWGGWRGQRLQTLQRERQVRTALGARQRVDLIDDDPAHAAERLPRLRGQDQIERLGRRDQDVRWLLAEGSTLLCRSVAGAHAHPDVGLARVPRRSAASPMPASGRAQVAIDVVHQRFERRHIEHPQSLERVARGVGFGEQSIETPQECGQGLARAGRGADERVVACRDGRPAL